MLTIMAGIGVVSIDRVLPLTFGGNIGTSIDNILGALAQDAHVVKISMTVVLFQVMFNILAVFLFYSIPFLRNMILDTAKWLGTHTCEYRWFSLVYIFVLFLLIPFAG